MANRWRVAALVLGPVVVGLAAWIVIDKTTSSSAGSNQGSALIDEFNAAVSRNDAEATLNTLSSDALFWSNGETFGPTDLRRKIATSSTLTLKRDEPVGGTGGYSFTFAKATARNTGLPPTAVMEIFHQNGGKIDRLWLINLARDTPFNIGAPAPSP